MIVSIQFSNNDSVYSILHNHHNIDNLNFIFHNGGKPLFFLISLLNNKLQFCKASFSVD